MSFYVPPANNAPVQKSAQTSAKVIKGGGVHNNSLTPTAGQEKTQSNITQTVMGEKLDNKTAGTNAGVQSVNNWINGNVGSVKQTPATSKAPFASNQSNNQSNTAFNLPVTAPLSESARIQQELVDDYNYNEFEKRVNESMQNATDNRDYAADLAEYMNAHPVPTAEDRKYVSGLNALRNNKISADPNFAQYADDVVSKRASVYAENGGYYEPDVDYETEIDTFLNTHPILTKESAAELQMLLDRRDAKMHADQSLLGYRNSDATARANTALNEYNRINAIAEQGASMKNTITDAYNRQREDYNSMFDYIDSDIALMKEMAQRERDTNIKRAEADALNQRRNLVAASPIADLALQEQLSAMGLSAGANNSSGYGETSRLQSQLATNNQISQNYNQLEQSKTDYNNAYLDAVAEAYRTGLAQKMDVQKLIAEIGPEAAMAIIEVEKWRADTEKGYHDSYQDEKQFIKSYGLEADKFDHEKNTDAQNFALNMTNMFGAVVSEDAAKILGIDKGTKTKDLIIALQENAIAQVNANANMTNAQTNKAESIANVALSTWQANGYATEDVAKALGVEIGTLFYDYVHDVWKTRYTTSAKTSSGGG